MVAAYAVVLVAGAIALLGWILARSLAVGLGRPSLDPEVRLGLWGRRVVAGMAGFGMGGMAAEFSPRDISWPLALVLAVAGGAAAVWYAGWMVGDDDPATGHRREAGLGERKE